MTIGLEQKQGAGPCAPAFCPWGPRAQSHEGGCLAGACADSTVQNLAPEIADMAGGLPPGRRLQVGFYATGHSLLGTPTSLYVARMMEAVLSQDTVDGLTFYTAHFPQSNCSDIFADEGCIVQQVFGALDWNAY